MDSKQIVTRRSILAKGMAAGMAALGLGALLRPGLTLAEADIPPTRQGADGQTTCIVFCDQDGKNCKRCCYDQYGYPMGCEPVSGPSRLRR